MMDPNLYQELSNLVNKHAFLIYERSQISNYNPDDYYEFWNEFLECIRNVILAHQQENRQRLLLINIIDLLKDRPFSTPLNPIVRILFNNNHKLSIDYV